MRLDSNNESSDTPSNCSNNNENIITTAPGLGKPQLTLPTMPKHIPFPEFPINSELLNELIEFAFILSAGVMQFVNIFRTSWWLPEANIKHTVNFYMIDPHLAVLIALITGRRLVYLLLLAGIARLKERYNLRQMQPSLVKYAYALLVITLMAYCIMVIFKRHTYTKLFLLTYPLVVYLLIFGFRIDPFLRSNCEMDGTYFNDMPLHCCSTSPTAIRAEIDMLKNDFNNRFKQVIFTSMLNTYFTGFVPCFFAGPVVYNIPWATENAILIWLTALTMCISNLFPAKYSDILHRASLHLGYWSRDIQAISTDIGYMSVTAATWNKGSVYPNSTVVRYNNELFRSQGPVTVAEPCNSSHWRFHKIFHNPSDLYMILACLQAIVIVTEITFIYYCIEWHFILSISFIALTGQLTLFKLIRDYLVTKRVYIAEAVITDKLNNAVHTD